MRFLFVFALVLMTGCYKATPTPVYEDRYPIGQTDPSTLSRVEMEDRIEQAYYDGHLTAEEAWKARLQIETRERASRADRNEVIRRRAAQDAEFERQRQPIELNRRSAEAVTDTAREVISIVRGVQNLGR